MITRILKRLTPGQLRFVSSVCRAILGFNDGNPKAFRFIVNVLFWGAMVWLAVSITLDLAGLIRAIADDPAGYLLAFTYLLFWPWICLLKLFFIIVQFFTL